MTRTGSPRRGVTLIEILCVIVLLAVVTTVLMALINHMLEAQRIQVANRIQGSLLPVRSDAGLRREIEHRFAAG